MHTQLAPLRTFAGFSPRAFISPPTSLEGERFSIEAMAALRDVKRKISTTGKGLVAHEDFMTDVPTNRLSWVEP